MTAPVAWQYHRLNQTNILRLTLALLSEYDCRNAAQTVTGLVALERAPLVERR